MSGVCVVIETVINKANLRVYGKIHNHGQRYLRR